MIEIIPNWHPVFVHFTVALTMTSVGLLAISLLVKDPSKKRYLSTAGVANLWIAALITLGTVFFGWLAYNSVAHDTASHAAMTDHRNWALVTAGFIVFSGLLSIFVVKQKKGTVFLGVVLTMTVPLLGVTAFKGGEAVYRYGLGVMSLPKTDSHEHGSSDHGHTEKSSADLPGEHIDAPSIQQSNKHEHAGSGHAHAEKKSSGLQGEHIEEPTMEQSSGSHDHGSNH